MKQRKPSNQSMKPTAPSRNNFQRVCHNALPWLISISLDVRRAALSLIAGTLFSALVANAAQVHDNFEKGEDEHDTYQRALKQILWQGWRRDVVLRMIVIPAASEKEYLVGVRRVGHEYRCFVINPSSQIWAEEVKRHTESGGKPDFSRIRGKFEEAPVREDIVLRIARLWRHGIMDPESYVGPTQRRLTSRGEEERVIYIDSTIFYFLVRLASNERLAAHTNDFQGPNANAMLKVGFDLPLYAHGAISEGSFQRTLAKAEKGLGKRADAAPSK
jgi:hypothetical protein